MATMRVTFPPVLERFLTVAVKQGLYASREAAIIAAVDRERRRAEQRARLTVAIQKGLDSGPGGSLNIERAIRRGRARARA